MKLARDPASSARPTRGSARGLVLSRGLLLYRWLDLANVPKGQRQAVTAAQLQAWSPFDASDYRVTWFESSAALFAWDRQRVAERLAEDGLDPALLAKVLPEPWLTPGPASGDAVRLLAGIDGFDGQVWIDGSLRASRFWTAPPAPQDWQNFLRGAGLAPAGHAAATPEEPRWQAAGWGSLLAPEALRSRGAAWEQRIVWAGSLALVALTALLAGTWWQQQRQLETLQQRVAALQEKAAPALEARAAALATQGRIGTMLAMQNRPDALAVLAHLVSRLDADGSLVIREFELNGMTVKLTLNAPPDSQRSALVKAIESGGWLVDVTEATNRSSDLLLTMRVNGEAAPTTPRNEPTAAAVSR